MASAHVLQWPVVAAATTGNDGSPAVIHAKAAPLAQDGPWTGQKPRNFGFSRLSQSWQIYEILAIFSIQLGQIS
jgi:hypothetical protein